MATEIVARKAFTERGPALLPASAADMALLSDVPSGRDLRSVITMARNAKRHRLYFGICRFILEHTSRFQSVQQIDQTLRLMCGHSEVVRLADGRLIQTAKTIRWGAMDETEFAAFFKRVVDFVATKILPGVTAEQIHDELAGMIGIERRAA